MFNPLIQDYYSFIHPKAYYSETPKNDSVTTDKLIGKFEM